MFRITKADQATRSVLTLDGDLSNDSIETLELCCQQAMARGVRVDVFLRDVSNIDGAARTLLKRLADMGVHLRGAGVYTSYILRGINPVGPHPPKGE